jgi:sulfite reductase alpha subunit-like flavoprotein
MEELFDVVIFERATRRVDSVIGERMPKWNGRGTGRNTAELRQQTGMERVNHAYGVEIVPAGKYKKGDIITMKAYRIRDVIVAAHNEPQAVGTWAAHFDEDPKDAGRIQEIDPAKEVIHFEQDDGSYEPGTLSEIMPENDPEVVIDPDNP